MRLNERHQLICMFCLYSVLTRSATYGRCEYVSLLLGTTLSCLALSGNGTMVRSNVSRKNVTFFSIGLVVVDWLEHPRCRTCLPSHRPDQPVQYVARTIGSWTKRKAHLTVCGTSRGIQAARVLSSTEQSSTELYWALPQLRVRLDSADTA